ncbi:MAG: Methyltransferase FkbM domain-containing protein [Pelagibacterales bacterium]|nr:Methyltransferase FkbM domain-containing protein [Pelagibacterales bacterium]
MKNVRGYFWYKNFNYLYKFYLLYIKHKTFLPKKTYSEWGEDLFVTKFFKNHSKGFYVDIGAYHPFFLNNTQLLFKNKWEGINVDINQASIEIFNKARPNDFNFNVAISNKNKKYINYYTKNMMNMLSTTMINSAKTAFLNKSYIKRRVKCNKLNYIISKTKFINRKIDFLNIDTEKSEVDVLKSLDFIKYKPKLICVEIHLTAKNKKRIPMKTHPTYQYLIKKKYKLVWQKGYSFIFLSQKF